jgi:hypothetical protein
MTEAVCKHKVPMDRTCLKCRRYVPMVDDGYLEKHADFERSIQDLEAALKPFLEEVEKAKSQLAELDKEDPPPPPDRPWYEKH